MAGTSWPALAAGNKAKASEVEAKFDWLEQNIVPMSGGVTADNTYDLGTSSARWRAGYFGTSLLVNGAEPATPATNTVYGPNIVKGFIQLNMSSATSAGDFNVSSITDNGVGDFTITWNTDFANQAYAVAGMSNAGGDTGLLRVEGIAVGTLRIINVRRDTGAAQDTTIATVIAIGDQS